VSDHLREAGIIVAHLSRALLDGSRDLRTVPGLIKRIISDDMWREWADPTSGRKYGPFPSFAKFVTGPTREGGLGSSIAQLLGLCEDDVKARDAINEQLRKEGRQGKRPDLFDNIQKVKPPTGTSETAALRRLRKSAPELHAEVLAERMSAHAAMVEAGFWPRTGTVRYDDPESAARSLRKHMKPDTRRALARLLLDEEVSDGRESQA